MSATETRIARPEAIAAAKAFVDALNGTYEDLVVAGSLRRRLAYVGDVEIVAAPKLERVESGLFGDDIQTVDRLHARMHALLDADEVEQRLDRNGLSRWGPTLKLVRFHGVNVDLFTPDRERFGWIVLLRTGPAAFSRQLVVRRGEKTKDGRPGLLPGRLLPRDGWLTWRVSGEKIPTPTERHAFEALGLAYIEPWQRS